MCEYLVVTSKIQNMQFFMRKKNLNSACEVIIRYRMRRNEKGCWNLFYFVYLLPYSALLQIFTWEFEFIIFGMKKELSLIIRKLKKKKRKYIFLIKLWIFQNRMFFFVLFLTPLKFFNPLERSKIKRELSFRNPF